MTLFEIHSVSLIAGASLPPVASQTSTRAVITSQVKEEIIPFGAGDFLNQLSSFFSEVDVHLLRQSPRLKKLDLVKII